jgi:hypothetical protein
VKVFDRNLALAGIAERDERADGVCAFAAELVRDDAEQSRCRASCSSGRAPQSTIDLTSGVYTDPRLLDVARAVERLPSLAAGAQPEVAAG